MKKMVSKRENINDLKDYIKNLEIKLGQYIEINKNMKRDISNIFDDNLKLQRKNERLNNRYKILEAAYLEIRRY